MDFYLVAILGCVLSFLGVYFLMPPYIKALKEHNINQSVSEYALEEYKTKQKTPIMGGLLFVVVPVIVYLVINMSNVQDRLANMVLLSYILFCLVGFGDDILIILRKNNEGLSPKLKLILELIFAIIIYFIYKDSLSFKVDLPLLKKTIELSWFIYLPFIILMFLGEANAVNFTDGMDGLCAGVSTISLLAYLVILLLSAKYNIFILVSCIIGGLLAYLCYNHFPAKIFMGDSGSLALGGLFASIALATNSEIVLLFIGGVFLIEMFCVCIQQIAVRVFHKRVFSYTPIHYAFVLKGHKETTVVKRFYILTLILSVIGLVLYIF